MFFSATIRWYASALSMYFTPKPSTTREKKIGRVMCYHNLGVYVTSKYPCGVRFYFMLLFASETVCGILYMDRLISIYKYPLFELCITLYFCMICSGNAGKGIPMYSYWSKIVQR